MVVRTWRGRMGMVGIALLAQHMLAAQYWERTYGAFSSEQGHGVVESNDDGFLILGSTGSFGNGSGDLYLIGLDAEGERNWSATYGGSGVEFGTAIVGADDGALLVGSTNSFGMGGYDVYLVRVDALGQVDWERAHGTTDWDLGRAADRFDDGWVVVGQTYGSGAGGGDAWVLRLDLEGDTLWTRTLGGPLTDRANAVVSLADGSCVVAGSQGTEAGPRPFLARLDVNGNTDWSFVLEGEGDAEALGLATTMNGDVIVTGYTEEFSSFREILMLRYTPEGNEVWAWNYGQLDDFSGHGICERADGGIAVAGFTQAFGQGGKDVYLLLTDGAGVFQSGLTFGSTEDDLMNAIQTVSDGGLIMAGMTQGYGPGSEAVYVIRTNIAGSTEGAEIIVDLDPLEVGEVSSTTALLQIYPNPVLANNFLTWEAPFPIHEVQLFDALGRSVSVAPSAGTTGKLHVPLGEGGMYFLRFLDQQGMIVVTRLLVLAD